MQKWREKMFVTKYVRVSKLKENEMNRHVAHMDRMRNAWKMLMRNPEGMQPFERMSHGWKDNIKVGPREVGCVLSVYKPIASNF
jgi:hypothetical protein